MGWSRCMSEIMMSYVRSDGGRRGWTTGIIRAAGLIGRAVDQTRRSDFPIHDSTSIPGTTFTGDTNSFGSMESTTIPNDTTIIKKETDVPTLTAITEKLNDMNVGQTDSNDTSFKKDDNVPLKTQEQSSWHENALFPDKKSKLEVSLLNARLSLHEFFTLFADQKSIPSQLFNEAKGIVFLSVIKGAIGIGGVLGSGILLARMNNQWSHPCAISLTGLQIGFDIGVERVDHILLLRDELALKLFQSKGTWNIGTDISIAAGPLGGDINLGLIANDTKSITSLYSYSMAKGAYLGISLGGSWISVRDDWNEEFYGRKLNSKDILYANISVPQNTEYSSLVRVLDECCRPNPDFSNIHW